MKTQYIAVVIIVLVAVLAVAGGMWYESQKPAVKPVSYYVVLADPPTVPAGTSSLNLTYSNVAVHIANSSWVYANVSGTVNIMDLVNVGQVIGSFSVPRGSVIDKISFYIQSIKIGVNGTVSNVFASTDVLTAPVINSGAVQSSGAGVLDINPVVNQIYVGSTPIYVMGTGAVAINVANANITQVGPYKINTAIKQTLNTYTHNVSFVASLSASGNSTSFTVTVTNNGIDPVEISGFSVFGMWGITPISLYNGTVVVTGIHVPRIVDFITINGTMTPMNNQFVVPQNYSKLESIIPRGIYSGMKVNFTGIYQNLSSLPIPWQNVSSIWNGNISNILDNQNKIVEYFSNEGKFNQSEIEQAIGQLEQGKIYAVSQQLNLSNITSTGNRSGITGIISNKSSITKLINSTNISQTNITSLINNTSLSIAVVPVYAQPLTLTTSGTLIPAHSSYTFTYSGAILVYEGNGQRVMIVPIAGNAYQVINIFPYSQANVTAT
ncbi:MAG: hypothetical protein ACP5NC_07020 [Nitrososphaeria archaeon]